jgi:hypothetical protein
VGLSDTSDVTASALQTSFHPDTIVVHVQENNYDIYSKEQTNRLAEN